MTVDSSLVDRIVHGVLQQMQNSAPPAVKPQAPPAAAAPKTGGEHRLSQPVITAGLLDEQVPRTISVVVVSPKAIVTPAAIDTLRSRKIVLRRETAARSEATQPSRTLAIVVRNTPVLERLGKQRAWRRELLGCPDDAATLAISVICRGEADRVVIFAAQHHRAAALANRNAAVKAVAVSSFDDLRGALEQIRANVLCVDPSNRADFDVLRLVEHFEAPGKKK